MIKNMQIKKIIALGDIHIFRSKRFNEHQNLFNKFYKIIDEENPDLVVIPGDVIDSKVNISPEQVVLLQDLLINIANRVPIIQILGNHDLNLQNIERKDLISAVIDSLKGQTNNPILFYPHSGIYAYGGINWAVWSCLDNQLNPYTIENIDTNPSGNNYTIGLFHGAVGGCLSDTGMELKDGIDISEFEPCDICILSDIHKRQSFRNNEINYTGNFIQVKENEVPHGTYLVYEWNEKANKHFPTVKNIDNEYSTLIYEITDIEELPKFDKIYEEQTIKLAYNQDLISKADVLEYKKKLQKIYNNKIDYKPIVPQRKKNATENILLNSEGEEIIKSFKTLLKEYLENQQKNIKFLKDLNEDYNLILEVDKIFGGDLNVDKKFEPGDFYFEKLIINNLYSFPPEDTEIDIFSIDGINGINGENRAGKSKIFASLMFCVYGSIPKAISSSKKIINKDNRDQPAYAKVYIVKNGKRYCIKRTIEPTSPKTEKVSYILEFDEVNENNESIQNLRDEKRQDTEKIINRYFGTEETFELLSMFSAQKKQIEFIDCLNSLRLEYANKFMGLQEFEFKFKEASEEFKTQNKVYQELLKDFNDKLNIDDLENEVEEWRNKIISIEENNVEYESLIKKVEEKLYFLNAEYQKYKIISDTKFDDIDYLNYQIEQKKKLIKDIDASRNNKFDEINKIELKRKKIDDNITDNKSFIKINLNKIEELKLTGKKLKSEFQLAVNSNEEKEILFDLVDIYKKDIIALNKSVAILESEILTKEKQLRIDICNNCGKEFSEKDKELTKKQIKDNQDQVIVLNNKINDLSEKESNLKKLSKECKAIINTISSFISSNSNFEIDISKLETEKSNLDFEIQKIENKYLSIDNEISKIQIAIIDLEKKIEESVKIKSSIELAKEQMNLLNSSRQPLEQDKQYYKKLIDENNVSLGSYNQKIKQLIKEIEDYKRKYDVIKDKEEEIRLLSLYREIIAKDGLPLYILKQRIGAINNEINTIINQIFDFDLKFTINEETGELKIEFMYDYDKDKSDVALASGSETFITNLCIRVGLSQISEIPKCLSLNVDEGFGVLDSKNVDKIPLLFNTLLNYYKNIILVSHLDVMKEIYTYQINVVKDKYTKII